MQNTVGLQLRNDDIANVGLYHTQARIRLDTRTQGDVLETTGGIYAQNEIEWAPWLRTMAGLRADCGGPGRRHLQAAESRNSAFLPTDKICQNPEAIDSTTLR